MTCGTQWPMCVCTFVCCNGAKMFVVGLVLCYLEKRIEKGKREKEKNHEDSQ